MEFLGTKGRWEVIEHSWSDTSLVCDNKTIAMQTISEEATEENQQELEEEVAYNFKLMSKAPELLAFLQEHYRYLRLKDQKKALQLIKEATTL